MRKFGVSIILTAAMLLTACGENMKSANESTSTQRSVSDSNSDTSSSGKNNSETSSLPVEDSSPSDGTSPQQEKIPLTNEELNDIYIYIYIYQSVHGILLQAV